MRTNCVNCGAAIDVDADKCPFCSTSYFDLTAIDFTSRSPVALRMRVPFGEKNKATVSMLAIPELGSINQTANAVDIYGGAGHKLASMVSGYDVDVGLSFHAVSRNNTLFTIKKESSYNG